MMQQSLSVIFFAALIILSTTLATPFQQFSTNPHSSDIDNDYPLNNLEASYDGGDAAVDSSKATPVSIADNSSMEGLHGNFLLPSPPSWQGIDDNIAPQFTCDNSDAYCCTGRYIRRKGWVLGPCLSYSPKTYECQQISNLYCCTYLSAALGGATGCDPVSLGV